MLIATDETNELNEEQDYDEDGDEDAKDKGNAETKPKKSKKSKFKQDKEYGVSRGVDFRNVACVLNFDLPTSSRHIFIELEEQQELEKLVWHFHLCCRCLNLVSIKQHL